MLNVEVDADAEEPADVKVVRVVSGAKASIIKHNLLNAVRVLAGNGFCEFEDVGGCFALSAGVFFCQSMACLLVLMVVEGDF